MKKANQSEEDEMRASYDFSSATRNPYAKRYSNGSNIVMIRPEIFAAFPSEEAVNDALAALRDADRNVRAKVVPARRNSGKCNESKSS